MSFVDNKKATFDESAQTDMQPLPPNLIAQKYRENRPLTKLAPDLLSTEDDLVTSTMGTSGVTAVILLNITVFACIAIWIGIRRFRQHFLIRHFIYGPKPDLLAGNYLQLKKDRIGVMARWIKEYGSVFGMYMGEIPYMVISDADMIKECFVKESQNFHDRQNLIIYVEPFKSSLLGLFGAEWKRVRALLNPLFSTAKLKTMMQIMLDCSNEMMNVLDGHVKKGQAIDVTRVSQGLSLDVIAKSVLAWQVDCQSNPTEPLLTKVREVFDDMENAAVQWAIRFPVLRTLLEWAYPFSGYYGMITQILDNVRRVVKRRRGGKDPPAADMLQVMLDAQAKCNESNGVTGNKPEPIEDRHLLSNCFIFLAAGFDTTATSLAFVLYTLAKYPEEQERVYSELAVAFPDGEQELTFHTVQELKRLDMVVKETLRMYPPVVLFVARACAQERTVMGQYFPKGVNVIVPTWHVHHDPELWPEPFKFDPERFGEGYGVQHPGAYIPFGLGPRVCIGKKFALLEMKLAICKILRKYKVCQCEQTQDPIKILVPSIMIAPEKNIVVKLDVR